MDVEKGNVWEIRPTTKWHMRLPERIRFPCFCPFLASPCQGQRKKVKGKPGYQPWVPNFLFWSYPSEWQLLSWPPQVFFPPQFEMETDGPSFSYATKVEGGDRNGPFGCFGTLYFQNHSKGKLMHSWNRLHSFFITWSFKYSIKTRNWRVLRGGGGRERERCFCLWYEMWYNVFQNRRCLQMRRKQEMQLGRGVGLLQFSGAHFHFCLPFSSSQTLHPNYSCCKAEWELSFRVLKIFLNYTGNVWIHSCCKRIKQRRSARTTPPRPPPPSKPLVPVPFPEVAWVLGF